MIIFCRLALAHILAPDRDLEEDLEATASHHDEKDVMKRGMAIEVCRDPGLAQPKLLDPFKKTLFWEKLVKIMDSVCNKGC